MDVVQGQQNLILYTTISETCPDPTLCEGKRGLVNLDTILGPGKGIWVLQWDCSFSAVIWFANHRNAKCHCCYIRKSESSARTHAALQPVKFCPDIGLYKTIVNIGNYTAVSVGASLPMLPWLPQNLELFTPSLPVVKWFYTVLWALHHH